MKIYPELKNQTFIRIPRSGLVQISLPNKWEKSLTFTIFHSDRGSQYASHKVNKILKAWDIHQSMSHKGNCFDNAMMESFFSSLKKELVHLMTFHSKEQARRAIFEYIEIFYNRQRRHSALNQKSPLEYYQNATQAF